ncbi:MAG: type II toxin-antitoxin system VapC family toxin [Anaerolineaceae bacterium]|nr:type II toxin-antitoxin system VapC family toxin [Anaerolineaceae bacterium]
MANYIVDASVVIEYLITGPYTPNVQAFFNQITSADRLTVPEFCLLECTNVIWKQVRFSGMSRGDAEELLRVLRTLKLRRAPMKRLLDRALDIALNNTLAVYDSGYVALALHYGYPLISIDQPQIRAATAEGVTLIPVTAFKP